MDVLPLLLAAAGVAAGFGAARNGCAAGLALQHAVIPFVGLGLTSIFP